ncbi:hypothetical protein NQZ68_009209 [Dissostichus eleginoides]|nr:hypothetical protein NQZ68_009209 [Dissostichus eleginoides]
MIGPTNLDWSPLSQRNLLAGCQSVCFWAVGQFGSTVLIQHEQITWLAESFAIGFALLRMVTAHSSRPSPLLLYGQLATWQFFSVVPHSASLMLRPNLKMVIFGPGAAYAACTAG